MSIDHEMDAKAPRRVPVQIVNAFVTNGRGGNPAGVVLDADNLSEAEMQQVAAATGLSETAFVSRSETSDFKLDFFTPTRRIPHCGHATIATFSHLRALGRVGEGESSKETIEGPRKILLSGRQAFMEQLAPSYIPASDWPEGITRAAVLQALAIGAGDLLEGQEPLVVRNGNGVLLVPLASAKILAELQPDMTAIAAITEALDVISFYPFTLETEKPELQATTRMFGPAYGIPEEAATGMAAGALAEFLYDRLGRTENPLLIEQGRFMAEPSTSLLTAKIETGPGGEIAAVMVGGEGKVMREFEVTLDG